MGNKENEPLEMVESNTNTESNGKAPPLLCSMRFGLAVIGFFGFVNLYALRVNMSVAMVCMINQTALHLKVQEYEITQDITNDTILVEAEDGAPDCVNSGGGKNSSLSDGEFDWSKETQGIILGSFFWGYLITQIPGGLLSERFGGKRVLGYFMFMTAVATLLTPVGSRVSPHFLIVLRIIAGLGQGVVFPAMHSLWSNWAPPLERSKLIGFTYAGAQIGNVLTLPISGILCSYGFDGGWPSIFYVLGGFGVLWFIAWMLIVSDTPSQHPKISATERDYIRRSIGDAGDRLEKLKLLGTPWRAIFSSPAVWGIIFAHMCANWGTYTLLTNIPAYMREVLKFDIKTNGALSAIPYLAFWAFINIGGNVADFLRARGWKTVTVRKISLAMGTLLPGIFLIGTGFVTCENPFIAVAVLTLAVGFSGFQYSGCMVNHVDIAPPFAGLLFGISNTAATLPGFLAPYAIGKLTTHQTQQEWQTVFYISAAIYTVGCILFCILAAGETQPWAKPYMQDEATTDIDLKVPLGGTTDNDEPEKDAV